jgi:hypothetical protein
MLDIGNEFWYPVFKFKGKGVDMTVICLDTTCWFNTKGDEGLHTEWCRKEQIIIGDAGRCTSRLEARPRADSDDDGEID